MKVTSEQLPDSQVLLNIEVDQEAVDKSVERAYRRLANQVSIPGFRRGKAPRHLVERYVGKEALLQEGVEILLPDVYRQAVEEAGIHPIDQPALDVSQMEPLVIKATVPVEPVVELGDYKSISLSQVEVAVGDQQVSDLIERMRDQHAEWVPVERPVQAGDQVTLDAEAETGVPTFYNSSGEPIIQMGGGERVLSETGAEYVVNPESKVPFPGFHTELVGISSGHEKKFQVTLPDDFSDEKAAGKNAIVRVLVHSIKEKHLPEVDDEFAKTMGEFETVQALRDEIQSSMQRSLEMEARQHFESSVIQAAVNSARLEIPPSLIEREIERMVSELQSSLSGQGVSVEQYLSVTGRANMDDMKSQFRPEAERRVRTYFVLNALGKAEGIEVSPEEIEQEIDRMATRAGQAADRLRQALNSPENRENVAMGRWNQKVINRLVEIATSNAQAAQAEAVPASAESASEESEIAESAGAESESVVSDESGLTESSETPTKPE